MEELHVSLCSSCYKVERVRHKGCDTQVNVLLKAVCCRVEESEVSLCPSCYKAERVGRKGRDTWVNVLQLCADSVTNDAVACKHWQVKK